MSAAIADGLFYAAALVALVSALFVVGQRHPIGSAFALVVTMCSLSIVYGLLGSPFVAVLQVVVYAGAIMVLFLFVLMLLRVERESDELPRGKALPLTAGALGLVLLLQLFSVLLAARVPAGPAAYDASTARMARLLFSVEYLYVFEATSILILSALVGAVVLAKKEAR